MNVLASGVIVIICFGIAILPDVMIDEKSDIFYDVINVTDRYL